MIKNYDELEYIAHVTGKPILAIFNQIEDTIFYYLIDDFRPAIPSNYVYDCSLKGRLINSILKGIFSFSANPISSNDSISILTKIEELPIKNFVFKDDFAWVKII